jgi:hypothetical protein
MVSEDSARIAPGDLQPVNAAGWNDEAISFAIIS